MKRLFFSILLSCLAAIAAAQGYSEQEVTIRYTDSHGRDVTLAGTLSVPDGEASTSHRAIILISGSGQQNRDEELMGHRPFKVIADYMAARGIVVLRCDDRGIGGSTGLDDSVTTLDFAEDVEAMYRYLRQQRCVNRSQIGLVGHSEGGLIAPIVASRNTAIAFVVMLAGPGMNGAQTLIEQNEAIYRQMGYADTLVARRINFMQEAFDATDSVMSYRQWHPEDTTGFVKMLLRAYKPIAKPYAVGLTKGQRDTLGVSNMGCFGFATAMATPWMQTFCRLEPADYLSQLQCPVLAVGGSKDCQVIATSNLHAIEQVCHHSQVPYTTHIFPQMNHLFQVCETGAVEEYATLGQSPDEEVLRYLYRWISSLE